MSDYVNFETFLVISPKKFQISVINKMTYEQLYTQEKIINNHFSELDLNLLDVFLEDNIFKVEKLLSKFIENINLIVDYEKFFSLEISIKKN